MSKLKPRTPDQPSNKDEFIDYYALQNNNIRLQDAHRSSSKEMIEILMKCSTGIQEWKEKWFRFYADNHSKIPDNGSLWDLFGTSVSSIDDFIDKINGIIDKLKCVRESIPKSETHQTLKFKIKQARADVDRLDSQVKELEEEKKNLQTKIDGLENSSSNNFLNCVNHQTRLEDFIQRQASIEASIKHKKKSKKRKEDSFNERKFELYEKSKEEEIKRCQRLSKKSSAFLKSFDINSNEFDELLKNYDPETDFNRLEKRNFPSKCQLIRQISIR